MKKTLLTFSVLLALICCTLTYAVTGKSPLTLLSNLASSTSETNHRTQTEKASQSGNLRVNWESMARALSVMPQATPVNTRHKVGTSREGNTETVIANLWEQAPHIIPVISNGTYDSESNTITFNGSEETSGQYFTGTNDYEDEYVWHGSGREAFIFSGTLTADGAASVYPSIFYIDSSNNTIYRMQNTVVTLDENNSYTGDFSVTARIPNNFVVLVGFLVNESDEATTITSTNNNFYYEYTSSIAQAWTAETDLPGLGLREYMQGSAYTVLCEDGITTIGIYDEGGQLSVTGINSTAAEVSIPSHITINGVARALECIGYSSDIDWNTVPNLTTLRAEGVNYISADFSNSTVTDLYVSRNCNNINSSNNGNVYLHIPYDSDKSDFSYYGFKRVLVGDETPEYPEASYSDWVIKGANEGEYFGISFIDSRYTVTEIFSSNGTVALPEVTPIGNGFMGNIRVLGNNYYSSTLCNNAPNLNALIVPASYSQLNVSWSRNHITELHMLGAVPATNSSISSDMTVYVGWKEAYADYTSNSSWNQATILPEGWDFEWITVNVEKPGEFADNYLTQHGNSWAAANYLKVTGNINEIDLKAMKNLTALMKLDLGETSITSLPEYFMDNKRSLTEVKLPSTLTTIDRSAFNNCYALKGIELDNITTIGSYAFGSCRNLETLNLNGVQTIDYYAFYDCSKLNDIDLSTVDHIDTYAFANCTSLERAELNSASFIDDYAFRNCGSLKSVTLTDKLTYLGSSSLSATAIDTIALPVSLRTLKSSLFKNCNNLVKVELPANLSIIEAEVFRNCSALEEMTIPATVVSIGSNAFEDTAIKTFRCYATVPPAATSSFIGNNMDMSSTYLYVPPFSKDFYRNTQYWSDFYIMRSITDPIDFISVDRPVTINLEEEDNAVVANNPEISLSWSRLSNYAPMNVGQLTAMGEGTLSAGLLNIYPVVGHRNNSSSQAIPTLINYADKMRADNVSINMTFLNNYYNGGEWYFLSLPFDVKVSDMQLSYDTYWVIRRYDSEARAAGETDSTWVNLTTDDTLEAGKGYIVSVAGGPTSTDENGNTTYTYPRLVFNSGNSLTKNNMFRSTDVIVPLSEYTSEFAHNRSWNLIGNPYPCYFDMHYLNEEFTAPVTVWNGSSYVAYSPVDDDLVLAPYEAFFVQCPLNATEMTFKEAGRLHSDNATDRYKAPALNADEMTANDRSIFNFEVSNEAASDRARIVMNSDAAIEYEQGRDAAKFFAPESDCAQLYVSGDALYSICERPVADGTATIGIRASKEEVCTLSLSGRYSSDWHVILTDNATGVSVDLTQKDYSFTATKGDESGRFSVKFMNDNLTGIDSVISDFGMDADVTVTAINGTIIFTGKVSDIKVPETGLYIISNGKDTRKVVLK